MQSQLLLLVSMSEYRLDLDSLHYENPFGVRIVDKVSTFPIVVIFFRGCDLRCLIHNMLSVSHMYTIIIIM